MVRWVDFMSRICLTLFVFLFSIIPAAIAGFVPVESALEAGGTWSGSGGQVLVCFREPEYKLLASQLLLEDKEWPDHLYGGIVAAQAFDLAEQTNVDFARRSSSRDLNEIFEVAMQKTEKISPVLAYQLRWMQLLMPWTSWKPEMSLNQSLDLTGNRNRDWTPDRRKELGNRAFPRLMSSELFQMYSGKCVLATAVLRDHTRNEKGELSITARLNTRLWNLLDVRDQLALILHEYAYALKEETLRMFSRWNFRKGILYVDGMIDSVQPPDNIESPRSVSGVKELVLRIFDLLEERYKKAEDLDLIVKGLRDTAYEIASPAILPSVLITETEVSVRPDESNPFIPALVDLYAKIFHKQRHINLTQDQNYFSRREKKYFFIHEPLFHGEAYADHPGLRKIKETAEGILAGLTPEQSMIYLARNMSFILWPVTNTVTPNLDRYYFSLPSINDAFLLPADATRNAKEIRDEKVLQFCEALRNSTEAYVGKFIVSKTEVDEWVRYFVRPQSGLIDKAVKRCLKEHLSDKK